LAIVATNIADNFGKKVIDKTVKVTETLAASYAPKLHLRLYFASTKVKVISS
jgi:hypothetical protein